MAGSFAALDFHAFHQAELPQLLRAGNSAIAAGSVARLPSLAFHVTGEGAYTYSSKNGEVDIAPGDETADVIIELSHQDWEGVVQELETAPGLLYADRVTCRRGKAMDWVRWEPALRAIYTGRPILDPHHVELADRGGAPLDVEQSFAQDDDPEDMAHFLRTTGYLFVRSVFASDEISAFLDEAAELRGEAKKGDRLSWWGKNANGEEILCRVTRAAAKPHLASIPDDARILRLVELADQELVHRGEGEEGVSVIYKNPDMTEGLSDIPWHRDCGMGGHAVMCPRLIASLYLSEANPETGELKMLPGSWTGSVGYMDPSDPKAPRGACFSARPGDLSLHYGDVMHAAPPPRGANLSQYRISAITGFGRPDARNHRGDKSYNDVLHRRADGQIEHMTRVAERTRSS